MSVGVFSVVEATEAASTVVVESPKRRSSVAAAFPSESVPTIPPTYNNCEEVVTVLFIRDTELPPVAEIGIGIE